MLVTNPNFFLRWHWLFSYWYLSSWWMLTSTTFSSAFLKFYNFTIANVVSHKYLEIERRATTMLELNMWKTYLQCKFYTFFLKFKNFRNFKNFKNFKIKMLTALGGTRSKYFPAFQASVLMWKSIILLHPFQSILSSEMVLATVQVALHCRLRSKM